MDLRHNVKRILLCTGPNDDENDDALKSLGRLRGVEVRITRDMACLVEYGLLPYIVLDDFLDEDGRNHGSRFYGLDSILRFARELAGDVIEE